MTYPNNPYPQQPQQPQQPGYGYPPADQPAPGYGAPQPGYGAPQQPAYGAPQPGYGAPQPGYGAPQQPAYGAPQPGYEAPKPAYDAQPAYGAPQQPAYGAPQQPGFGAPQPAYAPFGGYGAQYASWGARVGAYLIDTLIIGVPAWILEFIAGAAGSSKVECTTSSSYDVSCSGGGYNAFGYILVLLALVVSLGGFLYFAYLEGTTGQTIGKKTVGIKLIRESDGQPVGFGLAIGRKLLHIIDALPCYIGFLWPLWDDKKQTFADKIVSTTVVKA